MTPAGELRDRLRGLAPAQAQALRRVVRLMDEGDHLLAGQLLFDLALAAPDHPEVLRWRGLRHSALGEWADAVPCLARAAAQRAGDFGLWLPLATAQHHTGDDAAALHSLRAAAACAHGAAEWLALSLAFDRQGHVEDALAAVQRALHLDPRAPVALLQRARCLKALGDAPAAAADCRALIARDELAARAWFSLVDLKTVPLQDGELARLADAAARAPAQPAAERAMLEFALGKALEDAGEHAAAFAALGRANALVRAGEPWDAAAFSAHVDAVQLAFATGPAVAARPQGGEVIFLVGLPRSGTTLVEQILASHSQVEGASELPYLQTVVERESRRRGQAFPRWVHAASADDWTRLGQDYLALSARWRARRPVATDKLPGNWLLAGAALRMLPQARVIDCRRDALETCWSCYKQLFGPGLVPFSHDFRSLARYWHDYDRLTRQWHAAFAPRCFAQHYEALVADPPGQIRALLERCGLPFEPGCLDFHTAQRAIRTPSALQVRQPLRRESTPAAGYGELLAPLRALLQARGAPGASG